MAPHQVLLRNLLFFHKSVLAIDRHLYGVADAHEQEQDQRSLEIYVIYGYNYSYVLHMHLFQTYSEFHKKIVSGHFFGYDSHCKCNKRRQQYFPTFNRVIKCVYLALWFSPTYS